MRFRAMMLEKTCIDPFITSLTISSVCNKIYRKLFMKKDSIGIIPFHGYNRNDKQSATALKWIKWISLKNNIQIRHAKNGGEVFVGPYKVDGISGQIIFEFNGCYYHGCKKCFKNRSQQVAGLDLTADDAFARTLNRKRFLESKGYTVVEIWGCELEQNLKNDQEMAIFFKQCSINDPLDPREGINFSTFIYKTIS